MHRKSAMRNGSSLMLKCLLYMHGALADLAKAGLLLPGYHYTGHIENFLYKKMMQTVRLLS
jgi:hypothetical protein